MNHDARWLVLATLAGCAVPPPRGTAENDGDAMGEVTDGDDATDARDDGGPGDVSATAQPFYYSEDDLWPTTELHVCFDSGAENYPESQWVRQAVERTWEVVSGLDFVGWGTCDDFDEDISIDIDEDNWPSSLLGTEGDSIWVGDMMHLNYFRTSARDLDDDGRLDFAGCYSDAPATGVTGTTWSSERRHCIESIAVHEFGHALGLAHEDQRPEKHCTGASQGSGADDVFGAYDPISIMNYCSPVWNNDGHLSAQDIAGVQYVYGRSSVNNDFVWYMFGNVNDLPHAPGTGVDALLFETRAPRVRGTYARPFTGNFDGEAGEDIFWYQPGSGADLMYAGQSDRRFFWSNIEVSGNYLPIVGRFNADGIDDIYWYGAGTLTDYIWFGGAGGRFTTNIVAKPFNYAGTFIPLGGDFNGDGHGDIVWYQAGSGRDYIWWGAAGNGAFTQVTDSISGSYAPFAGDFDGDGMTDIEWYGPGSARDFTWWGTRDGSFVKNQDYPSVSGVYRPFVGDFDGNGTDDILWDSNSVQGEDKLWLNDHARGGKHVTSKVLDEYTGLVGDFDADGKDDLFWYTPG